MLRATLAIFWRGWDQFELPFVTKAYVTVSQPLRIEGSAVVYASDSGGHSWSVPIDTIILIAEYTTDEGPWFDDYFVTFVTVENGQTFFRRVRSMVARGTSCRRSPAGSMLRLPRSSLIARNRSYEYCGRPVLRRKNTSLLKGCGSETHSSACENS
jgi:hypothetical protein